MTILFYPGQEDYITELNKLAAIAELTIGDKGWSPVIAAVTDGARVVLQVSDWIGGQGAKPAAGQYLTLTGLTNDISQATNVRGASGANGTNGTNGAAATIAVGTVTTGPAGSSASVTNVGTSSAATFNFTIPKGVDGTGAVSTVNSKLPDGSGNVLVTPADIPEAALPALRPTLLLDFANSRYVDPRITFTRASTATRVNEKGLIETVAANVPRIDYDPVTLACKGLLIEEQRTNLLTYSEQFNNAAWGKSGASVSANATTAPDSSLTADKIVESNAASGHSVQQVFSATSGTTYVFSVYAKLADARRLIVVLGGAFAANQAVFNFVTGAVTGVVGVTAYIEALPNGWYRCAVMAQATSSATTSANLYLENGTAPTYTGDGTSGIYIWGAQLEAGSYPTSYIPSSVTFTGRASAGSYFGSDGLLKTAASGEARMNYNPTNLTIAPKLLLEEARTNLLTYSEQFDNAAWIKTRATISANAVAAPDGTTTADKLIETTDSLSHSIDAAAVALISGTRYTASIYAKAGERTELILGAGASVLGAGNFSYGRFNLQTGVASTFLGDPSASMVAVGNGWYRCTMSFTSAVTGTLSAFNPQLINGSGANVYTGDGTSGIYLWGAQLEAGSYPTSYIKTEAAQVTRAADTSTSAQTTRTADVAVMTGGNFSSWYRQDEGTFVVEYSRASLSAVRAVLDINDGTVSNRAAVLFGSNAEQHRVDMISAGSAQAQAVINTAGTVGTRYVCAFAYKLNDFAATENGAAAQTDTSFLVPSGVNAMSIGRSMFNSPGEINAHIRRIAYYPVKLSSSQLQTLTA